jgi:hypothetical protein
MSKIQEEKAIVGEATRPPPAGHSGLTKSMVALVSLYSIRAPSRILNMFSITST